MMTTDSIYRVADYHGRIDPAIPIPALNHDTIPVWPGMVIVELKGFAILTGWYFSPRHG